MNRAFCGIFAIGVEYRMSISATEFKRNMGKYIEMAAHEDIYITKKGKIVAKLTNPYQTKVDIVKSLFGILPNYVSLQQPKEERLSGK